MLTCWAARYHRFEALQLPLSIERRPQLLAACYFHRLELVVSAEYGRPERISKDIGLNFWLSVLLTCYLEGKRWRYGAFYLTLRACVILLSN